MTSVSGPIVPAVNVTCGWVGMNRCIDEEGGEKGVEDRKGNAKHYNVSQHDSERREGWVSGWVGMNR
jgi:hypothetical protein